MKRFIATTALALMVAITHNPGSISADIPAEPFTVHGAIVKYAQAYAAPVAELNLIINDESGFSCNPKGSNDHGLAYGVAQYHRQTFDRYSKLMGEQLNYYSCEDQIKLMAWQFSVIPTSKCEWSKYRKLYCK